MSVGFPALIGEQNICVESVSQIYMWKERVMVSAGTGGTRITRGGSTGPSWELFVGGHSHLDFFPVLSGHKGVING